MTKAEMLEMACLSVVKDKDYVDSRSVQSAVLEMLYDELRIEKMREQYEMERGHEGFAHQVQTMMDARQTEEATK
jgi:hypothetical protein